jgi:tetratricopeptide (TPR) repeat protein
VRRTKTSAETKTATDTKSSDISETHYTSTELAHLNNTAVHEINLKHFASAIKTFERLLEISPNYAHAKDNLVIAHNNYGLELAMRHPEEALKQFRAALYLDPSQAAIRKNVSAIMRENGQDPTSIEDRMTIADQCLAKGEAEGAFIELSEALRIKNTSQLREKLQAALAAINNTDSRRANQALTQRERERDKYKDRSEVKLDPRQEAKAETKLEAK